VPLLPQTYRCWKKIYIRFASKYFTLLCTFLYTLILVIYPSHGASDDVGYDFLNNLFNSFGGGSSNDDPWL
jgi:hypothetical protein